MWVYSERNMLYSAAGDTFIYAHAVASSWTEPVNLAGTLSKFQLPWSIPIGERVAAQPATGRGVTGVT